MKNIFIFTSIFFLSTSVYSQQKYALIVAVTDYPSRTEGRSWSDLSSSNDVSLVKGMLKEQGFETSDIQVLEDADANTSNVMKAFEQLIAKLNKGDIVYFHYSGHGQQIADLDPATYPNLKYISKDEHDGYDEALALYNAPIDYFEGYDFTGHLIDDQLDYFVTKIETMLGANGHLVCVLDACHSGSGTRGTAPAKRRGSKDKCRPIGYKPKRSIEGEQNFSDLKMNSTEGIKAIFMGCRNDEINYETEIDGVGYGSLTYGFVTALSSLKKQASYDNVFKKIKGEVVSATNGEQTPEFMGDSPKSLMFGGAVVLQPNFIDILSVVETKKIKVQAGWVHGCQLGDSIAFYSVNINDPKNTDPLYKGTVIEVQGNFSIVGLNSSFDGKGSDYALFKAYRYYEVQKGQHMNVALKVDSKEIKKQIKTALKDKENISIVSLDQTNIDYYLTERSPGKVFIELPYSGNPFKGMPDLNLTIENKVDSLVLHLEQCMRIDYLRNLELGDEGIEMDVYVNQLEEDNEFMAKWKMENPARNIMGLEFEVNIDCDEDIYIYALSIDPNRRIDLLPIGRDGKGMKYGFGTAPKFLFRGEKSKKTHYFACEDGVDCGMQAVYVFASYDKMNFEMIEEMGKSLSTRGPGDSEFSSMVKEGASGKNRSAKSVSGVTMYKYEFELKP